MARTSTTIATNVAMNQPNGLWVRGDGTVYVLDTGNGKVRRLDTNGMMTTLFTDSQRHQRRPRVVGERR